jgi:hypothetical protein
LASFSRLILTLTVLEPFAFEATSVKLADSRRPATSARFGSLTVSVTILPAPVVAETRRIVIVLVCFLPCVLLREIFWITMPFSASATDCLQLIANDSLPTLRLRVCLLARLLEGASKTVLLFGLIVQEGFEEGGGPLPAVNVAVTSCWAPIVTVHAAVPEQLPPDQPANLDPGAGAAVRVSCCPVG